MVKKTPVEEVLSELSEAERLRDLYATRSLTDEKAVQRFHYYDGMFQGLRFAVLQLGFERRGRNGRTEEGEGGLTLRVVGDEEPYFEIGGMREEDE